jgi:deoxycytidylate deaminase
MQQLHAEIDAIIRCAPQDLEGAELIVVRARRDRKIGMARPCAACQTVIGQVGLRNVYFTVDSDNWDVPTLDMMDLRDFVNN